MALLLTVPTALSDDSSLVLNTPVRELTAPWDPTSPSDLQGHTDIYDKYTQTHRIHISGLVGAGEGTQ